MPKRIYQFKIELTGITPTVWRRIQVGEDYSFWDLHVAIQDAMGWLDYHLHLFRIHRAHVAEALEKLNLITRQNVGKLHFRECSHGKGVRAL